MISLLTFIKLSETLVHTYTFYFHKCDTESPSKICISNQIGILEKHGYAEN
jgi:hypothetical protein